MNKVILYYNFAEVDNPDNFCREHKRKCQQLNLFGRVYIAGEGINGTLGGAVEQIEQYKQYLWSLTGFEKTEFKEDEVVECPFVKLIVKTRPEIVTLKSKTPIDLTKEKGKYLDPQEWKEILSTRDDIQLIDVRNNYETVVGHFEGALCPDIENFYDFEEWVDRSNLDKNKKTLMYCTGGIRCEKFSVLMEKKGFKDVLQLHGGIINYAKTVGGAHYKGKCFVFDDRLTVPIEEEQKEPLGRCAISGIPCDTYINCHNMDCNRLFICSEEAARKLNGCCSESCMQSVRCRPFDAENIYAPSRKWYQYYGENEWLDIRQKRQKQTIQSEKGK
ncbi:MAG: rhodanese-related sulfurtransferase [Candidatus Omnitrophica bacterium]|nr:rhodanese-related sulfurtransferase [Candidatus Omnitrophota bacterium]MCB9747322.1 rhodanese-related sulfurtransferase [Candidatus Omnitrophota bacterium]